MLLYRYIVKEHIFPFFASLSIIVFLFIMQQAIMMLDRIVSKNIDPLVVLEVFLIQLGWILALGVPMAILSATLMTFGRMSGDNEITAIKASGRSMSALVVPVMSAAAVVTVALFFFHDLILPEANHRAANLLGDISRKRPAAFIEPGVLIRDFQDYAMYVDEVNPLSGNLKGIRVFTDAPGQDPTVTVAENGAIRMTSDGEYLELSLFNGETHGTSRANVNDYFVAKFQKQVVYIKNVDSRLERTSSESRGDREKNIAELMNDVRELEGSNRLLSAERGETLDSVSAFKERFGEDTNTRRNQNRLKQYENRLDQIENSRKANDGLIAQYMVEVHKKFAIPAACLIFVLIGAPLGIMARRGGLAVGASYSVFFFIMYWVFLIAGENMADKMLIAPAVGMWAGNVFLALCGALLMTLMMRETSINFGFLKGFFGKSAAVFKRVSNTWAFRLPGQLFRLPSKALSRAMGTLPTYLIMIFLGYAAGLLLALIVIFITIDYVSNLRKFENAAVTQIVLFYWYYLPFITQTVLPIVIFLSSMFSMGKVAKSSELTAMKAAGVNVRQLTMPLLFLGLLLSGAVFYGGEMVIPRANEQRALLNSNFGKPKPPEGDAAEAPDAAPAAIREYRRNFFYFAAPDIMYVFNEFCTSPQFFRGVRRYAFTQTGLSERVDAAEAEYDSAGWRFVNGQTRAFTEDGMTAASFKELPDGVLKSVPLELVKRVKSKESMSYWELSSHIEAAKHRGEKVQKFMAELQFKIALPFMNFIVILFGLSLAARTGRRGGAALFGVGLLLSFLYWILSRFALVFAQNGYIPVFVGAWIGNAIFLLIGLILYRKAAN
ncbi:MAG: LptF/LptG family permease [Chitinispirillales bacterium]|jgi:lipopolysaccharide export system permease protein|nr:LptF/LptG family permease [Chitinispirillales bacterium]